MPFSMPASVTLVQHCSTSATVKVRQNSQRENVLEFVYSLGYCPAANNSCPLTLFRMLADNVHLKKWKYLQLFFYEANGSNELSSTQ